MKIILKIFLCIFIFNTGCDKDRINDSFNDDSSVANINGKWKVVSYEDYKKSSITVKSDVDSWNGMDVIISFADDSIWGFCTTNSISGKYTLIGRYIHIISYGGTKIEQPEWGNMFSSVINDVDSFEINKHQLRLYYDDSAKSITLSRQ